MRILVDTNVLIDVLIRRPHFFPASTLVWDLAVRGKFAGVLAAVSLTNIHYIIGKTLGPTKADAAVRQVFDTFETAPVDYQVIREAILSGNSDFEDAVQAAAATQVHAAHVVTRDRTDFVRSALQIRSPSELVALV